MSNYLVVFAALTLSWLLAHGMMRWANMFKEEDAAFIYFTLIFVLFVGIMSVLLGLPFYMR